jgi:hypothetical protein
MMMAAPWQQQKLVLVPVLQGGADSLEGLPFILILTVGMCMHGPWHVENQSAQEQVQALFKTSN